MWLHVILPVVTGKDKSVGIGIGTGLAVGVAVGSAIDNIALGIVLGIAIGALNRPGFTGDRLV